MDLVARLASVDLYGGVFVHKRPLLIGVTFEAHRVLGRRSSHLLRLDGAVRVVAITALN